MKKFLVFPTNLYVSKELDEYLEESKEGATAEPPIPLIGKIALYPPDIRSYYQAFSMGSSHANPDMPELDQVVVNTPEDTFTVNATFKEFEKKLADWYKENVINVD